MSLSVSSISSVAALLAPRSSKTLVRLANPNAAVFHLAAVAFEADGAGGGDFEGGFEDFAVAGAMGDAVFDDDDHFVPILRFVVLQVFVRAGEGVIAALQLRLADEYAAVGVGGGAKFEFQGEIFWKFFRGPKLLDPAVFWRRGYDESTVLGHVAAIIAFGFSIEIVRLESPTGQILSI